MLQIRNVFVPHAKTYSPANIQTIKVGAERLCMLQKNSYVLELQGNKDYHPGV